MSPDSFDDVDRALASGLSDLAPEVNGADEMLASLRPGFQRARTRNRAMKVGGAVAVLVVIGSVAAVAAPSSRRSQVQVEAPPTTAPTPTSKPAPSSTTSTTTTSIAPVTTTSPTTGFASGPVNRHPYVPPYIPPATVPQTTPATAPSANTGGGPGPTTTTTTVPPPVIAVHTFTSPGGRVRVRLSHGKLTIVKVVSEETYGVMERYQNAPQTFVAVAFSSEHGGWWVRVRVVKGRMAADVESF
jgi:hypothetical protein